MSLTRRQLLEKQERIAALEQESATTLTEMRRLTRRLASIRHELQMLNAPEPPSSDHPTSS